MQLKIWDVTQSLTIEYEDGSTYVSLNAEDTHDAFIAEETYESVDPDLHYYSEKGYLKYSCTFDIVKTSNPTVNDDVTYFIDPGTRWSNTSNSRVFFCEDNSDGAAVWNPKTKRSTGTSGPQGSVTGFLGDEYYRTDLETWYKCISDPSGTDWVVLTTS